MKRTELLRLLRRRHHIPLEFIRTAKGSHEIWGMDGKTFLLPRQVRHGERIVHKIVGMF